MTHPRYRFALLALAGGAVLAWLTWRSRADLLRVLSSVSPYWIAASVLAGITLNVIYGLLFDCILSKYGGRPHPTMNVAVYLMSQPGKYLPGKVWQAVMQSIFLRGHSGTATVGFANIELSLAAVLHATGLGFACLLSANPVLASVVITATLAIGWSLVRFQSGRVLLALVPRLRSWLRSGAENQHAQTTRSAFLLVLTAAALACNFAASWWLLRAAHTALPPSQIAHLLASLWLGIATSLLALPIPAGIGIREAAVAGLGTVIAPDVSANLLISIALLARCWQLLVDVSSMLTGWLLWHAARRIPEL